MIKSDEINPDLNQFDQNLLNDLQAVKLRNSDLIQSLLNKKSRDELTALRLANDRTEIVVVEEDETSENGGEKVSQDEITLSLQQDHSDDPTINKKLKLNKLPNKQPLKYFTYSPSSKTSVNFVGNSNSLKGAKIVYQKKLLVKSYIVIIFLLLKANLGQDEDRRPQMSTLMSM